MPTHPIRADHAPPGGRRRRGAPALAVALLLGPTVTAASGPAEAHGIGLAAGPAPIAAHAAARAARPTLAPLPAEVDAGTRVRLRGTAPARAVVVVQQRRGGAWSPLTKARSGKTGAWRASAVFTGGGTTQVRAVVGRRAGAVRSLAVYQWLDLATQPGYTSAATARDVPVPIGSRTYPHSILAWFSPAPVVWFRLDGACTTLTSTVGLDARERARADGTETFGTKAIGYRADGSESGDSGYLTGGWDQPREVRLTGLTTATRLSVLTVLSDPDDDGLSTVLGSPRVRCNAAGLAPFRAEDLP